MNARTYTPVPAQVQAVRLDPANRYEVQRWVSAHGADAMGTKDGIVVTTEHRMFLVMWGEWVVAAPAGITEMDNAEFVATYRET